MSVIASKADAFVVSSLSTYPLSADNWQGRVGKLLIKRFLLFNSDGFVRLRCFAEAVGKAAALSFAPVTRGIRFAHAVYKVSRLTRDAICIYLGYSAASSRLLKSSVQNLLARQDSLR